MHYSTNNMSALMRALHSSERHICVFMAGVQCVSHVLSGLEEHVPAMERLSEGEQEAAILVRGFVDSLGINSALTNRQILSRVLPGWSDSILLLNFDGL